MKERAKNKEIYDSVFVSIMRSHVLCWIISQYGGVGVAVDCFLDHIKYSLERRAQYISFRRRIIETKMGSVSLSL